MVEGREKSEKKYVGVLWKGRTKNGILLKVGGRPEYELAEPKARGGTPKKKREKTGNTAAETGELLKSDRRTFGGQRGERPLKWIRNQLTNGERGRWCPELSPLVTSVPPK